MAEGEERKFQQDLWDGFDAVIKRLNHGRADVKLMGSFFKERAKNEEIYAKHLQSVAKQNPFTAKCSVAPCWVDLTSSELSLYKQHNQFAVTCNNMSDKCEAFSTEMKNLKASALKTHSRITREREVKGNNHKKAQEAYANKMAAAEHAINDLDAGKSNSVISKQLLKIDKNAAGRVQDSGLAHQMYLQAVNDYAESQKTYDTEINAVLDSLEAMETRRIKTIKEMFATYNQFHGFIKNALEQISLLSTKLDEVDSTKDIQKFIKETKTKAERPSYVEYKKIDNELVESYKPGQFGNLSSASTPSSRSKSEFDTSKNLKKGKSEGKIKPPRPSVKEEEVSVDPEPAPPTSIAPPLPKAVPDGDSAPPEGEGGGGETWAVSLYKFETEDKENLVFDAGKRIKLHTHNDEEDWWSGELADVPGVVGMFPRVYVEMEITIYKTLDAKCKALFRYVARDDDELSFAEGEELIIQRDMDGWYLGSNTKGECGIFPANHVELVV